MINRTYFVNLYGGQRQNNPDYVDICVRATMGTRLLPVADPLSYGAAVTAPPADWVAVCGGAAYYEVRGRTLRLEHLFGEGVAAGYTQRSNLGFRLTVTPYGDWSALAAGYVQLGGAQLSQSLLEHAGGDTGGAIPATDLVDPAYGVAQPVIRVFAPQVDEAVAPSGLLLVSLDIAERKDDDFSNIGSP